MQVSLILTSEHASVVDRVGDIIPGYRTGRGYFQIYVSRTSLHEIRFQWQSPDVSIALPALNLEWSRSFYSLFASFFRHEFLQVPVSIDLNCTGSVTYAPPALIKSFMAEQAIDYSLSDNSSGAKPRPIFFRWKKSAPLLSLVTSIHYLFLVLSSVFHPHKVRHEIVKLEMAGRGIKKLLDLGCGNGAFLADAYLDCRLEKACGVEVSAVEAKEARKRMRYRGINRQRVKIVNGDIETIDVIESFEAISMVEVIEHLTAPALMKMEELVFKKIRPKHVFLTTPDKRFNEYLNLRTPMRRKDHMFEWTLTELEAWVSGICKRFDYDAEIMPVGGRLGPNFSGISNYVNFTL